MNGKDWKFGEEFFFLKHVKLILITGSERVYKFVKRNIEIFVNN